MGFGSILRKAANVVKGVSRIPGVGAIPVVGNIISAAGLGAAAYGGISALGGGGGGSMPALPAMPMGVQAAGLPAAPGMGDRSIFRDDPNVVEALKPFAIATRNLKQYYRAPKGFVVMKDAAGDAYGIPREIAKKYLGWKPAKKPLLSIRDTNAIKRAGTAIKKLQNAEKMAKRIANWKSPARRHDRPTVIQLPGPTKVGRKVA